MNRREQRFECSDKPQPAKKEEETEKQPQKTATESESESESELVSPSAKQEAVKTGDCCQIMTRHRGRQRQRVRQRDRENERENEPRTVLWALRWHPIKFNFRTSPSDATEIN